MKLKSSIIIHLTFFVLLFPTLVVAQNPKEIIAKVNQQFGKINDYSAAISMQFDIPSVRLEKIAGKVFYKKPNKFRIRTEGIIFLPKQNPYFALTALLDTNSYTAVLGGEEKINNALTTIITILPNNESDLIVGKFWIDKSKSLIIKSQLTTRGNGTLQMENFYGNNNTFALPEKMIFTLDVTKFKVPKAIAVDINSKTKTDASKKGIGTIQLMFSDFQINKKISDTVFTDN